MTLRNASFEVEKICRWRASNLLSAISRRDSDLGRPIDQLRDSNRSPRIRNRSLDAPALKFRILKIHRAETYRGICGLRRQTSKIPRQRPDSWPLTSGNVAASQSAGCTWWDERKRREHARGIGGPKLPRAQAARVSDYSAFMYLGELVEFDTTARCSPRPRIGGPSTTSPAASADASEPSETGSTRSFTSTASRGQQGGSG
jgi:hypothetical protein